MKTYKEKKNEKNEFFKSLLIFCLVLFSLSSHARPSFESLFKNSFNADVDASFVVLDIDVYSEDQLKEKSPKNLIERLKYYLVLNNSNLSYVYQLDYGKNQRKDEHLKSIKKTSIYDKNFQENVTIGKRFFMAMLGVIGLNDTYLISKIASQVSPRYRSNNQLLNQEKKRLYQQHLEHLKKGEDSINSPIFPKDKEEKIKIDQILSSKMYERDENVKLVKMPGEGLVYLGDIEKISITVRPENRKIIKVNLDASEDKIQFNFSNYILFNGKNSLPEAVFMTSSEGDYFLSFTAFAGVIDKSSYYRKRLNELDKLVKSFTKIDDPKFPWAI